MTTDNLSAERIDYWSDENLLRQFGFKVVRDGAEIFGEPVDFLTWNHGPELKIPRGLGGQAIVAIANHWMYGVSAGKEIGRIEAFAELRELIGVKS